MDRRGLLQALPVLLIGCSASSKWMHEIPKPAKLVAPPDQALLVIMRPSSLGFGVRFTIVDATDGAAPRYLGHPLASSAFAVTLPPGEYRLVAWSENADVVHAKLAAGKVYFVLASVRMGVWKARVGLTALTPRNEEWVHREKWLEEVTYYDVDRAGGQTEIAAESEDVQGKIRDAEEAWQEYDAAHRAERQLNTDDGL